VIAQSSKQYMKVITMKNSLIKFSVLAIAVASLGACSSTNQRKTEADAALASEQIAAQRDALNKSLINAEKERLTAQEVQKPYLAGNSRPLARGVNMPDVLRKPTPVTALFQRGSVDLATALEQLSGAANITITATADALLPAGQFAIRTGAAVSPNTAPTRVVIQAVGQPLWTVLDDIARQSQTSWRPVAGGAEFYRVETKVFYLAAIPQSSSTNASLGRNGGSTAFESQSKTSFESKDQNLITGLTTSIKAMLTQGGTATISPESQTVVVTDTKESLDRIEVFIKDQNKAMSRRVRVLIEAIEVVDKSNSEFGVDWAVLYNTASQAAKISTVASLVGTQAASIGLTDTNGGMSNGSSVVIKALNEVGTVVNRRSFPFLTTSGRPVTQAIRTTFNYVDQVQTSSTPASSTSASSTAPTVVQKDETVGTFVTLVPTAKPDGTIFLSVSFDVTSAQPLVPFTIGSGSSGVTVQQKTIDGTGVIQEVPIRSGQTVVIGGIETQTSQNTERRLGYGVPLIAGGSDSSRITKTRMVLLVTALTEEGI
jgi:type IVB pilus formation R64 PilN family outer membrane protein